MSDKERERYLKTVNRCIRCGKKDAFTLLGKRYCFECAEKAREANKRYYWQNHEKELQRNRDKRIKRKAKSEENGLCTNCNKRKATDGYKLCEVCRAKLNKKVNAYNHNHGTVSNEVLSYSNLCHLCRKRPCIEGKNTCKECYEKCRLAAAYATETRKAIKQKGI